MIKITSTLTILLGFTFAVVSAKNVDSLQRRLDTTSNDCLKAELYTNLAAELIQFNGLKTREINPTDAGKAVNYVLKAIHLNSRYDDVFAIRNNYDCLASAYFIQKKYAEAKWFILQSINISRNNKDDAAIINSLVKLASVKLAIKDYKMAERDFIEAIAITVRTNQFERRIGIEKCLATLYNASGQKKLELATEKRFTTLEANLAKNLAQYTKQKAANQQKYMAMIKLQNAQLAKQKVINQQRVLALAKLQMAKKPVLSLKKSKMPELNIIESHGDEVKTDIQTTALDINTQD